MDRLLVLSITKDDTDPDFDTDAVVFEFKQLPAWLENRGGFAQHGGVFHETDTLLADELVQLPRQIAQLSAAAGVMMTA